MDLHEVVTKLVGPVHPVGDSGIDAKRYENLKELTELLCLLIEDLEEVAENSDRYEASMKKAGIHAAEFLANIANENHL